MALLLALAGCGEPAPSGGSGGSGDTQTARHLEVETGLPSPNPGFAMLLVAFSDCGCASECEFGDGLVPIHEYVSPDQYVRDYGHLPDPAAPVVDIDGRIVDVCQSPEQQDCAVLSEDESRVLELRGDAASC